MEKATRQLKTKRADGPTELVCDIFQAPGQAWVKKMVEMCNIASDAKVLSYWELTTFVRITNGKGNPLAHGSYQAIKSIERGMSVEKDSGEKAERESEYL